MKGKHFYGTNKICSQPYRLYAYLTARRHDGVFILRVEDTDQQRNIPESLAAVYHSLEMAGLVYDEGPGKDGGFGPYVQSQRLPIYQEHAQKILDLGGAYRCFCKKEEPVNDLDAYCKTASGC